MTLSAAIADESTEWAQGKDDSVDGELQQLRLEAVVGEVVDASRKSMPEFTDAGEAWSAQQTEAQDDLGPRISKRLESLKTRVSPREDNFVALQMWEGFVLEVGEESFLARLVDLLDDAGDVEAEIYLEEISPMDRHRVIEGAVFYWSIGYLDTRSGQRKTESTINFRLLPTWGHGELERAREKARETRSEIGWR